MKQRQALVPVGLAVLVTAALAQPPAPAGSQSAPEAGGHPTSTSRAVGSGARSDEDRIDAFDLLAESLGVDISEQGLTRRVRASLRPQDRDPETRTRGSALLRVLLNLQLRKTAPYLVDAKQAIDEIQKNMRLAPSEPVPDHLRADYDQKVGRIERFLERYFDRDALALKEAPPEDFLLATDFHSVDRRRLELEVLQQAATQQSVNVRFLIATLPDPIDSFTGWQFDPMLDAITQAITTDDYVLDRAHFPDVDAEHEDDAATAAADSLAHEIEPGVVIFRRRIINAERVQADRLMLLTIHENPAAGVHDRALANAIRLVARWPTQTPEDHVIRIMGPTFSGSSESVARALRMTRRALQDGKFQVRVVSGSATDQANKAIIEQAIPVESVEQGTSEGRRVTFQATVRPDEELIPALLDYVVDAGWSGPVAVLFEANTQYGRQIGTLIDRTLSQKKLPILRLPFPMNISHLRTTAPNAPAGGTSPFSAPSKIRHLAMEATNSVTDQIHQFHPETTATYMELALSELLETIDRERIHTVALLATDPRDKLFLAQQLARSSPDVSIVTAESDAIYAHPDYASYLQGALVVSSYPMWSDNQRLTYGFQGGAERRQFANGSAQGIYNAVLALLEYGADGKPTQAKAIRETPPLLEYGAPLDNCTSCTPAIWISTIGSSRAWPIRTLGAAPQASTDDAQGEPRSLPSRQYVFPVHRAAPKPNATFAATQPIGPIVFVVLCGALVVGTLAHAFVVRFTPVPASVAAARQRASGYHLAGLVGVGVLQALALCACLASWRANGSRPSVVVASLALSASLISLLVLSIPLWARLRDFARLVPRRAGTVVTALVVLGIAGWALGFFIVYAWRHALEPRADSLSFLARTMDLSSGVSPAVPLLLLIGGYVAWAFAEWARATRPPVALATSASAPLLGQAVHGDVDKMIGRWGCFNRSLLALPPALLAIAAIPVAITVISIGDPFWRPLATIEGTAYGRVVSTALIGLQALITLALLQFVHLWGCLKTLLRSMAWHPLADAYQEVPRRLFPTGALPRMPLLLECESLVAQWERCAGNGDWARANASSLPPSSAPLRTTFHQEMIAYPEAPWSASETWKGLSYAKPDAPAAPPPDPPPVSGGGGTALAPAPSPPSPAPTPQFRPSAHQTLVAMSVALLLRDAIARLTCNVAFIAIGTLLLFCSQTLFPFQLHRRLALLGWSYTAVAFTTILVTLLQMKRNYIVGKLSSPLQGESAGWDFALVLKIALLGIVPLATLFATQFPDLGGTILHWLQPVQKALP